MRPFNPFDPLSPYSSLNSRDHRKILVVDSQVAIIGEQHAHQVDAKTWAQRPFTSKFRERFWRLWEQWL